jgi:ribose transport system substrate-binding protein
MFPLSRSRRLMIVAASGAVLVALSGCSTASSGGSTSNDASASGAAGGAGTGFTAKKPLKVGYSIFDLKQPYWQLYAAGVKTEAKKLGWEYIQSDQKSSEQAQVSGSADLINQQISGLIVSPIQPAALPATVLQTHNAKIPIVVGDVGTAPNVDAYVESNNFNGGVLAGQYMVDQLKNKTGTKEIAILTLDPGIVVGNQRVQGFESVIKKAAGFKIVSKINAKQDSQNGFTATQNILSSHPKLAGIFTANDPEGEGASQAILQAGKNPTQTPLLVSFNGDPPALTLIQKNQMAATVVQDPYGQGVSAMDALNDLITGKTPGFTDAANKTIQQDVTLATKDNVQSVIESHTKELGS